jgi:tetratricopeptide (TPR) repeat protein
LNNISIDICPECLEEKLNLKNKSFFSPVSTRRDSLIDNYHFRGIQKEPSFYHKPSISPEGFINFMFWLWLVISISVFTYSVIYKLFPHLNLPDFPFYPYILVYASLILLIQFKGVNLTIFLIVLLNFGFAKFRGIFFSHFSSTFSTILFTVMFILSNISSLVLFSAGFRKKSVEYKSLDTDKYKGGCLPIFLTFALYYCLISPFYLGTIKPGPMKGSLEPEPYKIDHVYEEVLTKTTADREIGRRYWLEGKQAAYEGTKEGYLKSLEFFNKSIELIVDFSTTYAEMAYSCASIARISKMANPKDPAAEGYFEAAKKASKKAKEININNPTIFGVETIIEFYLGNKKTANISLDIAKAKAEKGGYSDRVVQAMALLEKKEVKKIEYLLGIKQISQDSAELFNLLGIAYYKIGNAGKAKEMFDRAVRLSPDYGEAILNLALVDPDKIKRFKEASEKDNVIKEIADVYSIVFKIQNILRYFFLFLLAWFVLRLFYFSFRGAVGSGQTIQPEFMRRIKVTFMTSFALFVCLYGLFEAYIHIFHPLNTFSHMFPAKFPFF